MEKKVLNLSIQSSVKPIHPQSRGLQQCVPGVWQLLVHERFIRRKQPHKQSERRPYVPL